MPNRLAHETSPYLLQHKDNPVDWYPWGEEALARAREERRPILLSIGYSACHWCHVMERESFEDPEIAAVMNELFVPIKLDREERPDLASIYMEACQAMTGQGGWPLNVFLTPDQVPFFAGTYFPPDSRMGMASWRSVLEAVAKAWEERRDEIEAGGGRIAERLRGGALLEPSESDLDERTLEDAVEALRGQYDRANGGFGSAPKFPPASALEFLLRRSETEMTAHTLRAMASGGMYDQVGGGFARYSVDPYWLVPHFEKMLYDNALLSRLYLEARQATGDVFYERIAEETLDYVVRDMTSPEGGFYSAEDADSEGEEGKFYVWTPEEIRGVLSEEEAALAERYWDVTERGNFEGKNILNVPRPPEVVADEFGLSTEELWQRILSIRERLFTEREKRVRPGRDEKVLAAWNGLMLRAFALAAGATGREEYLRVAEENAVFLLEKLVVDGRLRRSYKDGQARLNGYLEDYACVADGLVELYEATFETRWLREAASLADAILGLFWEEAEGAFYDTAADHEELVTRPRDVYDNATPSGNSVAVDVLLKLSVLLER